MPLIMDATRREVVLDGATIRLTKSEFLLLQFFVNSGGRTCSRQEIIAGTQGADSPVTPRAIDVQVLSLRKKLGPQATLIQAIRGVGYRFQNV